MSQTENWDTVIRPQNSLLSLNLREVWKYRDLIKLFVYRDFVSLYKQTILGPLWYIIQPVVSTIIFTIIFGKVAKIPTDGVPPFLFYMIGQVSWGYFAASLGGTSNTFVQNAGIFGKVFFPRLTVPISVVITSLLRFFIQFAIFITFYVYFFMKGSEMRLTCFALFLPLNLLQMALLGLGFGIIISSLVTKYRDLTFLMQFGVSLWMYASPVVYPLTQVPEKYRFLYSLNPMVSIIETMRLGFFGVSSIQMQSVFISWGVTLAILFFGIVLFNKVEKSFMDTV